MPKLRWTLDIITKGDCIISFGLFYLGWLMWDPDQRQENVDEVIFQDSIQAEDSNDSIFFWSRLRHSNLILVHWLETWTFGALAEFILQSLGSVPCTPAWTTLSSFHPAPDTGTQEGKAVTWWDGWTQQRRKWHHRHFSGAVDLLFVFTIRKGESGNCILIRGSYVCPHRNTFSQRRELRSVPLFCLFATQNINLGWLSALFG